ncbi:MAG: helix-turn-helix transcriptional regulator [Clostridia bacterium]|nr:helix-turn-helix transcriptional regulator [Clostridia bacterium]
MDWIKTFNELVQKIEDNAIGASYEEILKEVPDVSPYFKKMFMELTHVSLRDYLIQRKMYHCALALAGGENAADLSERAGYMSYEGFRMAFNRYQEANPNDIRKNPGLIKHSPPLRMTVTVTGGDRVSYRLVEVKHPIRLCVREFSSPLSESYRILPELFLKNRRREEAEGEWVSKYIVSYEKDDQIRYLIGRITDDETGAGEKEWVLSEDKYVVFDYYGRYEDSVAFRNSIFSDWMISETRYIPSSYILFEKMEEEEDGSYHIQIGIPVRDTLGED